MHANFQPCILTLGAGGGGKGIGGGGGGKGIGGGGGGNNSPSETGALGCLPTFTSTGGGGGGGVIAVELGGRGGNGFFVWANTIAVYPRIATKRQIFNGFMITILWLDAFLLKLHKTVLYVYIRCEPKENYVEKMMPCLRKQLVKKPGSALKISEANALSALPRRYPSSSSFLQCDIALKLCVYHQKSR